MNKKRILVVDDEVDFVKAIQIRLKQAGYEGKPGGVSKTRGRFYSF